MDILFFAVLVVLVIYVPSAISLLYIWWRYGKGDKAVSVARAIFLVGSVVFISFMLIFL